MGSIICGSHDVLIEDRLLAHVQIVIVNRFRQNQPLLMSWVDDPAIGSGRSAVWLHPALDVYFKFNGSRVPAIDRRWLSALTEAADSSTGLVLRDEAGRLVHASGRRSRP